MEGWKQKYIIGKTDGTPVDPEAVYFVLRLDKDEHARKAALAYMDSVSEENPKLAYDIFKKVKECQINIGEGFGD